MPCSLAYWSRGVPHRAVGVAAACRSGPLVPARAGLGEGPALRLLDPMAAAAARACVARACASALVVGGSMLEVAVACVPGAEREGTFSVPNLDEMPEGVAGLVAVRLMSVV